MRAMKIGSVAALLAAATACGELQQPRDVTGNFAVQYFDTVRVYIGDQLVAEAAPGEDPTISWEGGTFSLSVLCGEDGTECPSETFWREVAVDQPQGDANRLLNFVNLDEERGEPGQRMGGLLEDDGSFEMLAGLQLAANGACAAVGVATVVGTFNANATAVEDGMVVYEWGGGCVIGGVALGTALRIETDLRARRVSDYDVSTVAPEEPIDEEGRPLEGSRS